MSAEELILSDCGVGEDSWESLRRQMARRPNQSTLKEIKPEYSLERLTLKVKLQYLGHLMQRASSLEKIHARKDWGQEKGLTEDEMVGWHHQLNGHELVQTLGDGEGQKCPTCCISWGPQRMGQDLVTEQQLCLLTYSDNIEVKIWSDSRFNISW